MGSLCHSMQHHRSVMTPSSPMSRDGSRNGVQGAFRATPARAWLHPSTRPGDRRGHFSLRAALLACPGLEGGGLVDELGLEWRGSRSASGCYRWASSPESWGMAAATDRRCGRARRTARRCKRPHRARDDRGAWPTSGWSRPPRARPVDPDSTLMEPDLVVFSQQASNRIPMDARLECSS